jgi:hypothetical protein
MVTDTKVEVIPVEDDENTNSELGKKNKKSDKIITKTRFSIKNDPKVRTSYIVPEEIYPEKIDL